MSLTVSEQSISLNLFRLLLCPFVKFYSFLPKDLEYIFFSFIPTFRFMFLFSIRFLNWVFWRCKKAMIFVFTLYVVPLPKSFIIFLWIASDFLGEYSFMNYNLVFSFSIFITLKFYLIAMPEPVQCGILGKTDILVLLFILMDASNILPLNVFSEFLLYTLNMNLLSIFVRNGCWILSNDILASIWW